MWYVVQTASGQERELINEIEKRADCSTYNSCFVITAEDMQRREGRQFMREEILFRGYIFVDTDTPALFYEQLKNVYRLSIMLAEKIKLDDSSFLPVSKEEQCSLESLIDSKHMVRLSLVRKDGKTGRLIPVSGPLLNMQDNITNVDFHHRRAFINTNVTGTLRKIKLGICTEQDLVDNGLADRLLNMDESSESKAIETDPMNGITTGTLVTIRSGIYGDEKFVVKSVNPDKRTLKVEMNIFGSMMDVEVGVDEVSACEI